MIEWIRDTIQRKARNDSHLVDGLDRRREEKGSTKDKREVGNRKSQVVMSDHLEAVVVKMPNAVELAYHREFYQAKEIRRTLDSYGRAQ